jgi:hypothetical protein
MIHTPPFMKHLSRFLATSLLMAVFPLLSFAQVPQDIFGLVGLFLGWFSKIVPFLLAVIVLIVFWNLTQFILHTDDEAEREKYKQFMIWSVVSMFLILSFWGIIAFFVSSFFGSGLNPVLGNPTYIDKNGTTVSY